MSYYKPQCLLELRAPEWGANGDQTKDIIWQPRVISCKWVRNSHLHADEMEVTIHYNEGGVDPRMIKNAYGVMWMWDALTETYDVVKHKRFEGICKKASRKLNGDAGFTVDLTFHDYTDFFLMMKPFPTNYLPEWTDNLTTIWQKVCDGTGWKDRDLNTIVSTVTQLRDKIVFNPPELAQRTLGDMVTSRFHAISKPAPPPRCDAWAVWQWCCAAIGLVSYIDRDRCVVTNHSEFFSEDAAPSLIYGQNIDDFHEESDTHVARKGILGKSYDHIKGILIESVYPPPGDDFIKKSKASLKRQAKGLTNPINDSSGDYEEYNFHRYAQTQVALDLFVREAWEEFGRQQMKGSISTKEMLLPVVNQNNVQIGVTDILGLGAGDAFHLGIDESTFEMVKFAQSEQERVAYLIERAGYVPQLALLVARNIGKKAFRSPIYHVETLTVEYGWEKFNAEISFHNRVELEGVGDDPNQITMV